MTYKEEGGFIDFGTHRAYREQEKQMKTAGHRGTCVNGWRKQVSLAKGQMLLKDTRYRRLWDIIIAHVLKGYGT